MLVTIYTDASFKDGLGGWAVWIRSNEGRIVKAGRCPPYVTNALQAEVCAIYCGLHLAVKAWPHATAFLVRTDCQGACFDPRRPHRSEQLDRLRQLMSAVLGDRRLHHKWVKGHQRGNGVQAYLNRQCDLLAGRVTGKHKPATEQKNRIAGEAESG